MWMLMLISITSWIPGGTPTVMLMVKPSDWLEFSCNNISCNATARCNNTGREDNTLPCNSRTCLNVVSTSRNYSSTDDPLSVHTLSYASAEEVQDPHCSDKILTFSEIVPAGDPFSLLFAFKSDKYLEKVVCRGPSRSSCRFLKHGIRHNNESSSNIRFQIPNVDSIGGIYWFGVTNVTNVTRRPGDWFFFLRVCLIVVGPRRTSPVPSEAPPGNVVLICSVVLTVCILLLVPPLVYRVCSKKRMRREGHVDDENNINNYSEIVHGPPAKTIYATAHFYTNSHCSSNDNSKVTLKRSDCSTEHLYSTIGPHPQ